MIPQGGGRIILLSSQLAYIGRPNYTAYSAAKGGLLTFTRALAQELAPHGILVNAIAPGLIDTGFDPLPEATKRAHAASLPLKRLGTPEDLVGAFVFLAADESRYFCGQTLHPNGGEIMP
jgi:3-oxoacyl-[acyl-carrier protein] reductase